ncbi:ATP-binding protein [Peteryoungia ipomoeae]|uniref:histidine kinase n=1 Tax=Peteryoungia ipomoeae TaxID=1210932 RepID=A0A4S8P160_9HYPH|nr:ATP-binding protein [Peteryoungia ipomoeae]THV23648.1 PAS domain S-box protein [Peteryoungia ipomoeae]
MPAQYPFIDVAVHDLIRPRLARGEALVLFTADLQRVVWCNGQGARFFGQPSIYDFLEAGPNRSDLSFRQIAAAARPLNASGDRRGLMLRVTSGFRTVPLQASVERLAVRGEDLVLLALPLAEAKPGSRALAHDLMVGFDDPDTHMAVLDGQGAIVAASSEFTDLGIADSVLRDLVAQVSLDPTRLIKRPIATGRGHLPTAIGRISDEPPIHLLFTVDLHGEMDTTADEPVKATPPAAALDTAASVEALGDEEPQADDVLEDPDTIDLAETAADAETVSDWTDEVPDDDAEMPVDSSPSEDVPPTDDRMSLIDAIAVDEHDDENPDDWDDDDDLDAIDDGDEDLSALQPETVAAAPTVEPQPTVPSPRDESDANRFVFDRDRRAIRFVWKIDESGRFSEVSPEFAQAVGPRASDINGVAFSDLAALFNLDPDGRITELLKKRDTWSGKTIYWPVEGTRLVVPVDLAALPTYTRNRDFDGFRGFGIVRVADAIEDPNATGMTFVANATAAADMVEETTAEEDLEEFLFELAAGEHHGPDDVSEEEEAAASEALDRLWGEDTDEEDGTEGDDVSETEAPADNGPDTGSAASEDVLRFEPPVIRFMEPDRHKPADKIVQLDPHRRDKDRLTPGEQAAFREIGRKLDPLGLRARVQASLTPAASEPPALREAARPETPSVSPAKPENKPEPQSEAVEPAEAEKPAAVADTADESNNEPTPATPSVVEPPLTYSETLTGRRERSLNADIVDLMPVALLVHVGDRLIHANPEFFSLTGYTSLAALDEAGGLDELIQRQDLHEAGDQAGPMAAITADGKIVPVTARLQSVRFDDASALMLALIAQPASAAEPSAPAPAAAIDVPTAMTQEPVPSGELARLKVEVEEMKAILETATDGVVILDADGDIRSMNRAASALFNFDDMETRGKPFVMLFAHESQRSILDYLNGLSGHGVASVLNDGREVIGREASGGFLPLFMTIGRLHSSNGYCAVIRDITQWKRTEDELRSAKRAAETANAHKTDFLARVSHEIRTPLNAIIGFADMMANEHFGPVGHPRYGEYAHDIVRSGRHVLDIVNDLLDISKIEAGEMELDFASVGLNETVQAAVSIVQPQANSQRVIIRTALSQAVPSVVADDRSIKQIVLNILANAIRFTPSGGQIIVSSSYEPNGSVVLRIRDTGIGMSRTELEQAMKPFRQVSTGTPRNRGDGTGLGLPLTKAMVDANRAQFAISSTPNEGTLVEITFPSPRVLAD